MSALSLLALGMTNNMNITFILPGPGISPVGGFKVVYEYANCLSGRGHTVTIVHPANLEMDSSWLERSKRIVRYIQRFIDKSYLPKNWFRLDSRVQMLWVSSLNENNIPDADVVIATAWQTAEWISYYSSKKGDKFYLVQDVEDWSGPEARVEGTWRLPLKKIVISKWLQELMEDHGQTAVYIPNGLDFSAFGVDTAIESRNPHSVLMLYHHLERKGIADGLSALDMVRQHFPDLSVTLFGVRDGIFLPRWFTYYRSPAQNILRELYNHTAVFLAPSRREGWGLTASEAMMCGAAVVGTDIGGHREFMKDGLTALLAPAHRPEALADRLIEIFSDNALRINIARQGHHFVKRFTWARSCDRLETVLKDKTSG